MVDIPLAEAQVIWNYYGELPPGAPPVRVVHIERGQDDRNYAASWGACNGDFVSAEADQKLRMLFTQFIHLTVNEGLLAADVHAAFLDIPEYREGLGRAEAYLVPHQYRNGEES